MSDDKNEIRISENAKQAPNLSESTVKENDRFMRLLRDQDHAVNAQGLKNQEIDVDYKSDDMKEAIREDDFSNLIKNKTQESQGEEKMKTAVMKQYVSLKFGVVGSGQAGGRIAEVFYKYGYSACAINTARQDLEFLDLPDESKLFIGEENLGGAGRDLEFGLAAVEDNEEEVKEFLDTHLADADVAVLALAGGGGSGSGSAELLIEYLSAIGLPIVVIYALPGTFDDPQSKHNAIQTLSKIADYVNRQVVNSLVLVDNAKIEMTYPDLSPAAFWKTANNAVVEPLHMFNSVSAMPTDYESLDSMDFAKSLVEAGNCVVFGQNSVTPEEYEEDETALLEAMVDNLENGLLAGGFKLEEAQNVGILITANQSVLEKIPNNSLSYVFKYITEEYESARSFKGIYAIPSDNDDITIRFIFSGLGLPKERVDNLKTEAKKHMETLDAKKKTTTMGVDLGKDKTANKADRAMDKIKRKKSAIGRLKNRAKTPRRR